MLDIPPEDGDRTLNMGSVGQYNTAYGFLLTITIARGVPASSLCSYVYKRHIS